MRASVIVSTRNRARLLDRLLTALAAQTMPAEQYEILVVDDCSSDETPAVCRDWQRRLGNLTTITQERHEGLGAAGNRAVAVARGECLLFTDDDCIPEPDWVRRMTEALDDAPIVAGGIVTPVSNYFQLCHNIAQFHPFLVPRPPAPRLDSGADAEPAPRHPGSAAGAELGPRRLGSAEGAAPAVRQVVFVAGANLGVRREVMLEVGGFDEETPIPDMEWALRAHQRGHPITFTGPAAVTHDPPRVSCRAIMDYAADHAVHTICLRLRFRDLLDTPLVLRNRWLLLLTAPLIALRTTVLIYARNRNLREHWRTIPVVFLTKMAWCRGAARGLRLCRD